MSKVPFKVSARTARLIGRENVANASGAVVELVKNTYDADAKNCIIFFDNRYHSIPKILSLDEFLELSKKSVLISTSYYLDVNGQYKINSDISNHELREFFMEICYIYIIDNGTGMTSDIIENHWMTIGTDIKNKEYISPAGRVKTGAKGIGRFALDRLGKNCEMYTLPSEKKDGYVWKVDWSEFEKPNLSIDQISADLYEKSDMDLKSIIRSITEAYKPLSDLIENIRFDSGTVIKISSLADDWDNYEVMKIFENLEVLVPPKEMSEFKIHLLSSLEEYEYGEVLPDLCDDFDYKVVAKYLDDEDKTIIITIERNEFDISSVEADYLDVFNYEDMKAFPYDFETFKNKKFQIKKTLPNLLPGFKDVDEKRILDAIGEFSFVYYFLKNTISSQEKKYPYKPINSAIRKEWLRKFGGIKIFRDDFRIRPYGEPGYDWLNLGGRAAQSPGSAGQISSGYRVRPTQISGSVHISRLFNESFQDKSGREGLQENDVFQVFKKILVEIISVFETDRNHIMFYFKKKFDEEADAKRLKAEELLKQRAKKSGNKSEKDNVPNIEVIVKSENDNQTISANDINTIAEGFEAQKNELEQKEEEVRLSRNLSSSGLLIASFAHDFKTLIRQLKNRSSDLRKQLDKLLPPDNIKNLEDYENPYILINDIEKQDAKLSQWLKISLLPIKKDKRKRTNIDLKDYFEELEKVWSELLLVRSINLIIPPENKSCTIRAFPIDLDSLFSNLIANSIDAFKDDRSSRERNILITWKTFGEKLIISYSDTGCGLTKDYENPEKIFNAFETTKRDAHGNTIGTGLGMWIVKNIVDDYAGKISILKPENGFALEIFLPFRKQGLD